jgi:fructose/tagatose bisphosphate aldolase
MVTLREVLKQAETEGVAIGHFNVSDLITLKAVFESATDQNGRSANELGKPKYKGFDRWLIH